MQSYANACLLNSYRCFVETVYFIFNTRTCLATQFSGFNPISPRGENIMYGPLRYQKPFSQLLWNFRTVRWSWKSVKTYKTQNWKFSNLNFLNPIFSPNFFWEKFFLQIFFQKQNPHRIKKSITIFRHIFQAIFEIQIFEVDLSSVWFLKLTIVQLSNSIHIINTGEFV